MNSIKVPLCILVSGAVMTVTITFAKVSFERQKAAYMRATLQLADAIRDNKTLVLDGQSYLLIRYPIQSARVIVETNSMGVPVRALEGGAK